MIIRVIIPALNEEEALPKVLKDIPDFVEEVVVVDNNSTDNTYNVAKSNGATALKQPLPGYGNACLKGLEYVSTHTNDVIVFLDADYADDPTQMPLLINKIKQGCDLVIGSRALGERSKGSMTFPQVFGNWLATNLLNTFWRSNFTDLGPFRAVTWKALEAIQMKDQNFGWTVEMQLKAAKLNLKSCEVPVNYRKRAHGVSKVSGDMKGAFKAGYIILYTIFKNL